jgi:hypothetical protein
MTVTGIGGMSVGRRDIDNQRANEGNRCRGARRIRCIGKVVRGYADQAKLVEANRVCVQARPIEQGLHVYAMREREMRGTGCWPLRLARLFCRAYLHIHDNDAVTFAHI